MHQEIIFYFPSSAFLILKENFSNNAIVKFKSQSVFIQETLGDRTHTSHVCKLGAETCGSDVRDRRVVDTCMIILLSVSAIITRAFQSYPGSLGNLDHVTF